MSKLLKASLIFGAILLFPQYSKATHIVGGDLTYKCVGLTWYEFTLTIRRDCANGLEDFDEPAILGAFYGDNQLAYKIGSRGTVEMKLISVDTIRETIAQGCITGGQRVCVQEAKYYVKIPLFEDKRGYILAYQRCCRNTSLSNIIDPLETGSTYTVRISADELASCNSNPVFNSFPSIYTCLNTPFQYDQSATDSNADSLVYSLCLPYQGRTKADPVGFPDFPPFNPVVYKAPYGLINLLGGVPVSIDRKTGLLTGNPNTVGQFLVGICVDEYKDGKIVTFTRRDFELNIVPCGITPKAVLSCATGLCDGLDQRFTNQSTLGLNYKWYFDFKNNQNLTSTDPNPSFKFPKGGTYEVVLVAYNGGCTDTARKTITVLDLGLIANFTTTSDCKNNSVTIQTTNTSATNYTITKYEWTVTGSGTNLNSSIKDPSFIITKSGQLIIKLIITDSNGCTAMISKTINVNLIDVELIGNPTELCKGDSVRLVRNPNASLTYVWSPTTGLNLNPPSNPNASPTQTTTYKVTISDGNCSVERSVTINVRERVNVKITGDTATCDGRVRLTAMSDSTSIFEWSNSPSFSPIIATGANLDTRINNSTTFYVRAGSEKQCKSVAQFTVKDNSINLTYRKENVICAQDTFNVDVRNTDPRDIIDIVWTGDVIIGSKTVLNPTVYCSSPGTYILIFTAKNQFNCSLTDTIFIKAVAAPNPNFDIMYDCGSLTVKVSTTQGGRIMWDFGDNKGKGFDPMMSYTYEKSGIYRITLSVDSVCMRSITKELTVAFIDVKLKDTVIACHGETVGLNPGGNADFEYEWLPTTGLDNNKVPNPKATVSTTTSYTVTIKDPRFPGCSKMDTITVFVPIEIGLTTSRDTTLCAKAKIILKANASASNINFVWCDDQGKEIGKGKEIEVEPIGSTTYVVKATDAYGCVTKATIKVNLFELMARIEGTDRICKGNEGMIKVIAAAGTNYTYDWSPKASIIGPSNGPEIKVKPDGTTTYTVTINNGAGCTWTLSHTVNVNDPANGIFAKADPSLIVKGMKTQLTTVEDPNYTYKWSPNTGLDKDDIYNPIAMPMVNTLYTVTVTDKLGCTASASVTVTVNTCEESVFIPNAFSPNGDSKNDVFKVRSEFITKMDMVIYNRWGQEMFKSETIQNGWNGSYDGTKLGPDVYGYCVRYTCFDNVQHIKRGNISLLK